MHKAIDSAHGAVNKMANGANHAADAIAAKGVQLQHMQRQLTHSAKTQARTHPLLTLGIVLAGGALLSYWFSRRNNGNDAG
ncbi:hypothetical protein VT06_12185 [Arsukibacterium sp. MJ3]|nr:hypothetical protein VT06_12185 [Arsukibacterium sp. MJ3]